jgi:hypothetical protein
MGVYGQEDGFEDFNSAFFFGIGKGEADGAWRGRLGIGLRHSISGK